MARLRLPSLKSFPLMFYDIRTQKKYLTRKEAKQDLGHAQFNRLAKSQEILFIPTHLNSFARNYEQLHTNTEFNSAD